MGNGKREKRKGRRNPGIQAAEEQDWNVNRRSEGDEGMGGMGGMGREIMRRRQTRHMVSAPNRKPVMEMGDGDGEGEGR